MGTPSKILVIGYVWPEPKTTAAGNRMLQLLEAFLSKGYKITFACTATKTEYSYDLERLGIKEVTVTLNDSRFDVFVKKLDPEVVLLDRFMVEEQFGWRIADACPDVIRILNTEDLHSLRDYRRICFKQGLEFNTSNWLQQDKTKREIASILRSDLTLLVSSFEEQLLKETLNINDSLILTLPFLLDGVEAKEQESWPSFEQRKDFISFGNGKHLPNIDSFRFIKQTLWSKIREALPQANFHIYGAYLPQNILEMHAPKDGFFVHGWAQDIKYKVQCARVVLAPLRFGAGIKGKFTTAMENGTPTVTTILGAEGMASEHAWSGVIADTPKELIEAAVVLYNDKEQWKASQKNGISILKSTYNKASLTALFFNRLAGLSKQLENHRKQNFIGSLLQHQTLSATKYMGKWIEEKNKNNLKL